MMMMWRMTHICHLPGLVLMEKDWQVLVPAGAARDEKETEEEEDGGNENDGAEVMMMSRMKKFLMLRRSTPLPTYTWELQFSGYPSTLIGGRKLATRAKQIW
jgi:hypothetical protein